MTMQQTAQQEQLFAFGLGYSAQTLAKRLRAQGWGAGGTVRSEDKAQTLRKDALNTYVFDALTPADIPEGAHWLISVPPDEQGCPAFRRFGRDAARAASITYLSTTGVYGDLQGGWAFEWTPVNPRSDRAKRRVLAETQWVTARRPFRSVRLPGIYGPGRSPFNRIRSGHAKRILKPDQVFSRVHVDDIASGLEAMMYRPKAIGVFHLCDDAPAPPQDVTAYAAELLALPAPEIIEFESADLSPMARSFYAECKRVSNARAKSALGWFPKYRNYKDGLAAVLAVEEASAFKT